jgi:hypothetical protein
MPNPPRDDAVCVPEFSPQVRGQILNLLTPQQRAEAIQWNQARYPDASGLELREIQTALDNYVDWGAIQKAMEAQSKDYPKELFPAAGLVVEAIHQFQQRCFIEPRESDGKAGERTLDSLGLTHHQLPDSVDKPNARAQKILNDLDNDIQKQTQKEFSAANWFDNMVSPSFLGRTVKNGIHVVLARKLRRAERYFLSLPAYQGLPPVALGSALGIREEFKGARPTTSTGKSMHLFGLALDINYTGNPWVAGARDVSSDANEEFIATMRRASLLISGKADGFDAPYLSALSQKPTTQIYQIISSKNQDFRRYFELAVDKEKLGQLLARPDIPSGAIETGESLAHAADRWQKVISQDLENLRRKGSSFQARDPAKGFFDLHEDLVTALRDHAGLAWGAVDFGARESGDMMHFDDRREGVGLLIHNY